MSKILIVGAGFAGLWATLSAAREADRAGTSMEIEMIAPEPYLVLRPRLYEKDPRSLREPLLPLLDRIGATFVPGKVTGIDIFEKTVAIDGGGTRAFDRLVVATGSRLADIPVPGLAEHGFNVDTFDAATAFDEQLKKVAAADGLPGQDTFVVIGGGFTGIELALELRDRIAVHDAALAERARIVLIERADAVGPDLGANPRPAIERALAEAAIELRLGAVLEAVDAAGITLADGERITAATMVSAVGLRAGPLADQLPGEHDALGRVVVDDFLRVPQAPDIFATGDVARAHVDDEGHVALMSCQHALRMGRAGGRNAALDLLGRDLAPYRQPNYVTCLDLGRSGAIFTTGWDREVRAVGMEAKERKIGINRVRIYPPTGTREEILAAAGADPPAVR
jgi:NADH dehydrogenase